TECPVGIKRGMKVVKEKNLSQIVLEMLATLQSLDEKKARLIEMTVDGKIDDKEIRDFKIIQDQLKQMEETIHSLQLWIEHYVDKN
ncbi:MAG: XRE family transcriptional regulator, partial [Solobacterium sp.]|nr:XRE family transcriptional regulator [Solobacterium sp.]